jgi:maltooligosyltrehalose trehalohydrolase
MQMLHDRVNSASAAPSPGCRYLDNGACEFVVWTPAAHRVDLRIEGESERLIEMTRSDSGYHRVALDDVESGTRYWYVLDGNLRRADPASRLQPEGVHGPSEVVAADFAWGDSDWRGLPLSEYILYELHVGAYTPEGTLDAIVPRLEELKSLGVTAIELMPLAQFPGSRNWGYDGVFPYAVQNSYGGPLALKRLADACHRRGLAIVLDVVYNHLGPEGNYLPDFGPYFTDRYRTAWGRALNFDGPDSDEVRRFFIANALYWIDEFHIDALRFDAVHAVVEHSARPFLLEVTRAVRERADSLNRRAYVIAESDLNDPRVIRPGENGGLGFDAQWSDDFHHALHTLLTGERAYADFGELEQLAKAYGEGFAYDGQYSVFRRRRHGNSPLGIPSDRFVVCSQNHDQIGNREFGERLSAVVSFESLKLAAGATLLSPFLPLLFMGEEYGETAPFLYFTSHTDPELAEAVRRGRRAEFAAFGGAGEAPDPQDEDTFLRSKLNPALRDREPNRRLLDLYRELIRLRKATPPLAHSGAEPLETVAFSKHGVLFIRRRAPRGDAILLLCFSNSPERLALPVPRGCWKLLIDSSEERWGGDGASIPARFASDGETSLTLSPKSFALLAAGQ